jgi:hypothetical protein
MHVRVHHLRFRYRANQHAVHAHQPGFGIKYGYNLLIFQEEMDASGLLPRAVEIALPMISPKTPTFAPQKTAFRTT